MVLPVATDQPTVDVQTNMKYEIGSQMHYSETITFLEQELQELLPQLKSPCMPAQTWKNSKSLHNLNSIYFSYTGLFLAFTKEIAGKMKKFTQI